MGEGSNFKINLINDGTYFIEKNTKVKHTMKMQIQRKAHYFVAENPPIIINRFPCLHYKHNASLVNILTRTFI